MTEDVRPEPGTPEWIEYWADIIAKEQAARIATIAGEDYPRIPYGQDYPMGDRTVATAAWSMDRYTSGAAVSSVARGASMGRQSFACAASTDGQA